MAEYRRAEIVTGLFIVASVLVFALFAFKVKGTPIYLLEDPGIECEAWFADVKGMDTSAKVTIGGVRVGTVTDVKTLDAVIGDEDLAEERRRRDKLPEGWAKGRGHSQVLVRFKITEPDVRLGDDARVTVAQDGLIDPYHLIIDPGTWDKDNKAPRVADRGDRPIKLVSERSDSLQDSVKPIVKRVEGLLAKIDEEFLKPLLEGKQEQLGKIVPELQSALAEAGKGIRQIQGLLDPAGADSPVRRANKLLDDADVAVLDLKTQLTRDVIPAVQKAIADGQVALAAARKTMEDASKVLDESKPKISEILENLRKESASLDGRLTEVQTKIGKLLDDADHLATLKQDKLADIVDALKNTAWEIELAARKVRANPAVLIFGDDEKQRLEADPRDDTGLRKSGRVKPYEQRDETPGKKE